MDEKTKILINELGELRVKKDVNLNREMVNGCPQKAALFYIVTRTSEMIKVIGLCQELKINFTVIGSGSKIILSDKQAKGFIIKNRSDNIKISGIKGKISQQGIGVEEAFLEVDSGVSLAKIAEFASGQNLTGLAILLKIPGTIGGSLSLPYLLNKIVKIKVLTKEGIIKDKLPDQYNFGDIILSVIFKLSSGSQI